eukprot:gene16060-22197_t
MFRIYGAQKRSGELYPQHLVQVDDDDIHEEDICFIDDQGEFEDVDIVDDGSARDAETNQFDTIIGALQDILVDPEFGDQRDSFCQQHCTVFEDNEENKLEYTVIFSAYTEMIESGINSRLKQIIPGFDMTAFLSMLAPRKDELMDEVFDLLCSMGDFESFKETMLAYKNDIGGNNAFDIQVTPLRVYMEEQEDGVERPELDSTLQISPVGQPGPNRF